MIYEVYQKNDLLLDLQLQDENGDDINLQGADIYFKVVEGNTVHFIKNLEDGITVTNASEGKMEVNITADDTDIDAGRYSYELLVIDELNNRYTAKQNGFRILKSYTTEVG